MNDLISRSEVNDVIDELEVYTCGRPNTMKVEISVLQLQRFINKLKNIPTAYSVDDVVEELEEIKGLICSRNNCSKCEYTTYCFYGEQSHKVAIDKAIEIVKQGAVSDDVCKWRKHSICGFYSEHIGAVRIINIADGYKYCPYCGKKIKIVGD